MSALLFLARWKQAGAISEAQHDALAALARQDRFSLFLELNVLLYLGVLATAAGAGWTVATYSARLGDAAILATLSAIFGASLYYCVTRAQDFSRNQVESPTQAFDYVLYLGSLIFAVELGFIESRFHPFGDGWDHSLLLAAAVFFLLAYRFDNRFVLSLALSSLGGWFGVRVAHFGPLFTEALRWYALAYGALVAVAGAVLQRAGLKPHFLDAYLHVAAHVLFLTLLSGGWRWDDSPLYWLVLIALCATAIGLGIRFSRFAFVVYGVMYGYAGVSSRILRDISAFSGGLAYFVISGMMVIVALVMTARRFGREA